MIRNMVPSILFSNSSILSSSFGIPLDPVCESEPSLLRLLAAVSGETTCKAGFFSEVCDFRRILNGFAGSDALGELDILAAGIWEELGEGEVGLVEVVDAGLVVETFCSGALGGAELCSFARRLLRIFSPGS